MDDTELNKSILSLDVGTVRIGLSIASRLNYLTRILPAILNDDNFASNLKSIIIQENIDSLVVGLPRNLSGEKTKQTNYVEEFVDQKLKIFNLPVIFQDESLTSVKVEEILSNYKKQYTKADIDSMSALLILEDYLKSLDDKK